MVGVSRLKKIAHFTIFLKGFIKSYINNQKSYIQKAIKILASN